MVSSTSKSKSNYPCLLYKKGKASSQQMSMSYYRYFSNFQIVNVGLAFYIWVRCLQLVYFLEIGVSTAYGHNLIDLWLVLEICTCWSLEKRTWLDCYAFFILSSMEWLSHIEFIWSVRRRYLIWKFSRDICGAVYGFGV
ncbi:LOW QUALITY PROTEIN: hypothetical protein HID58_034021 [Brassica napus]|uniref:Uncharacterized protein n=1 Tax=Brassica napus TaxID=3708 RepID=A0ABQ8C0W3_BRANA|nr:LOW QUALITY PROTEIN: hypothetical protein HID58_034021 [Brassica napus]